MATITKSILIDTPPEAVFNQISHFSHWPEWWPRLVRAAGDSQEKAENGASFQWLHHFFGLHLTGKGTITDLVPNEVAKMETKGDIDSRWELRLSPEGNSTKLSVTLDYTAPSGTLGVIADQLLLEKINANELALGLENLKTLSEHRYQLSTK